MTEWKRLLKDGYDDIRELKDFLKLSEEELTALDEIQDKFPMLVNSYYLSLIDVNDPADPIRKMCIPAQVEMNYGGDFDTSGEQSNTKLPGLQHKYAATALVLSTNRCAMYCRHCFRKRLVGLSEDEIATHIDTMIEYVQSHKEINNVLISGGDAFLNGNKTIRRYLDGLSKIEHLDIIRFGTRTPVVLPQRITTDPEMVEILSEYSEKKQIYVVTQFNHPRELTDEAVKAVKSLVRAGIVVKNQTVLLRGINDKPEILGELLRKITACGIIPYYIFQCRPVTGVHSQFQVPLREGVRIVDGAKNMQSGQGKCIRYAMSHITGKIEILGEIDEDTMLFKYHQAKHKEDRNRIFTQPIDENQCWLDHGYDNE